MGGKQIKNTYSNTMFIEQLFLNRVLLRSKGWVKKLDGLGPVDNRPSTDKLHHFVQKTKQKNKKNMRHVTRDM